LLGLGCPKQSFAKIATPFYDFVGAFASASILAGLAIVTLILKSALEWKKN
jgi:ABC-type sulfate transport system permease subunit